MLNSICTEFVREIRTKQHLYPKAIPTSEEIITVNIL